MGQEIAGLWRAVTKKPTTNQKPQSKKETHTPPLLSKPETKNKQVNKKPQPTSSCICLGYFEQYQMILFCTSFLRTKLHIENIEKMTLTHHFPENLKQVAP